MSDSTPDAFTNATAIANSVAVAVTHTSAFANSATIAKTHTRHYQIRRIRKIARQEWESLACSRRALALCGHRERSLKTGAFAPRRRPLLATRQWLTSTTLAGGMA